MTQYKDTVCSSLSPEATRRRLQPAEGNITGILQAQAARHVDDKLCNNTVLNETVWLPAIRQFDWLKNVNLAHSVLQRAFSIEVWRTEQDPGLTSVLMKGLGWFWRPTNEVAQSSRFPEVSG